MNIAILLAFTLYRLIKYADLHDDIYNRMIANNVHCMHDKKNITRELLDSFRFRSHYLTSLLQENTVAFFVLLLIFRSR